MEVIAVAALADNLVIGSEGELPWESISEDKRQYRARVRDSPVILGRKTFEAMRDDLPGSIQLVLSRSDREWGRNSAYGVTSVEEALTFASSRGAKEVYVLGGAKIYELFLPYCDRMVLSRIPQSYPGDSTFPEWNKDEWEKVNTTQFDEFKLEEWVRRDSH